MKAPHFPLKQQQLSSGETIQCLKGRENVCLTSDKARYIYKKGKNCLVIVENIKQKLKRID